MHAGHSQPTLAARTTLGVHRTPRRIAPRTEIRVLVDNRGKKLSLVVGFGRGSSFSPLLRRPEEKAADRKHLAVDVDLRLGREQSADVLVAVEHDVAVADVSLLLLVEWELDEQHLAVCCKGKCHRLRSRALFQAFDEYDRFVGFRK